MLYTLNISIFKICRLNLNVCVCSVPQLGLTLCNPMDYSPQDASGSSYHGARVPEGVQLRLSLAGTTCLRNAPQETGSGQGQQKGGAEKEDYRRQNFWSEE